MNPPVIHAVFSSPVFTILFDRDLRDDELRAIIACQRDGSSIVDDDALADFREEILRHVDLYFQRVVAPIEMPQSIILRSCVIGRHCKTHASSGVYGAGYISGIFCVSASPGNSVDFVSTAPDIYPVEKVSANQFNAHKFSMEIEAGQIVLFPHTMNCYVNIGPGDEDAVILFSVS